MSPTQISTLTPSQRTHLTTLLAHKLTLIPPSHIPPISLSAILAPTPRITHIAHIPPDMQLAFFLAQRARIDAFGAKPVKSDMQHMDVTRAVWFYRLDEVRQFERWHDGVRWNVGLFTALVGLTGMGMGMGLADGKMGDDGAVTTGSMNTRETTATQTRRRYMAHQAKPRRDVYTPLTPSALRFVRGYLRAVYEQHVSPCVFTCREEFIRRWKNGAWDVFTRFGAAQKKVLKREMKRLKGEWEAVGAEVLQREGREAYEKGVGRIVGVLVPGRRDGVPGEAMRNDAETADVVDERVVTEQAGELLEALQVPLCKEEEKVIWAEEEQGSTVVDVRYAISVVQRSRARDMLGVLMELIDGEE